MYQSYVASINKLKSCIGGLLVCGAFLIPSASKDDVSCDTLETLSVVITKYATGMKSQDNLDTLLIICSGTFVCPSLGFQPARDRFTATVIRSLQSYLDQSSIIASKRSFHVLEKALGIFINLCNDRPTDFASVVNKSRPVRKDLLNVTDADKTYIETRTSLISRLVATAVPTRTERRCYTVGKI